MKAFIVYIFKVVSAFLLSFISALQSRAGYESSTLKVDVYEPVAGKKAIVTQTVTASTGEVDMSTIKCSARLSADCLVTSIDPGTEVTIRSLENDILYVFYIPDP